MAKNQTVDKKPKVVYNSDGSATVSGVKNMEEAAKAVQSSVKQSRERADAVRASTKYKNAVRAQNAEKYDEKKTAVDKMWDRQSSPRQRTEEDEAVSALVKARRNTEQKKKEKEATEKKVIDWEAGGSKEYWDTVNKKQAEVDAAQAAMSARLRQIGRAHV